MATRSLGIRLKAEREHRGFTLAQISDSTKIPVSLLEALERGDLSRWPKGLYRRAFFRSYVTALGLQVDQLVVEFTRLFPDDGDTPAGPIELGTGEPDTAEVDHPLALSWGGPSPARRLLRSIAITLLEILCLIAVGALAAWLTRVRLFEAIGVVALVYLPLARMAGGNSGRWHRRRRRASAMRPTVSNVTSDPDVPDRVAPGVTAPILERLRRSTTGIAKGRLPIAPVAGRTVQLVKEGAIRSGRATGDRLSVVTRNTARLSSRAFGIVSYAFWKGVRAAAEHTELLARRQLNRIGD